MSTTDIKMTALITSSAEEMNPSRRNTMEDCHVTHPAGTWGCSDADMTYLAVCDGHGGRDIVEFLEYALAENVAEELNKKDDESIHTRLERAFLITDVQSHMMKIETSGATVALCLIKKQPKHHRVIIHAANVGDARAVLSCTPSKTSQQSPTSAQIQLQHAQIRTDNDDGINSSSNGNSSCRRPKENAAYRLTCDHRADDPIERTRIEKAGGFVTRSRVLGILAVARSLGDHGLKEFVIGRPFVNTVEFDLNSGHDQFVIVGCDGLWDVVEDQDAIDLVRDFVHIDVNGMAVGKKEEAAQMLCNVALKRGSSDNITVVVTWL